jgi:hypothetical protein
LDTIGTSTALERQREITEVLVLLKEKRAEAFSFQGLFIGLLESGYNRYEYSSRETERDNRSTRTPEREEG